VSVTTPHDGYHACCDPIEHCEIHHVDEPGDDVYRYCLECNHVFPTEQALQRDDLEIRKQYEDSPEILPVDQIHSCPHCTHDW
jgi:hypothetical protein